MTRRPPLGAPAVIGEVIRHRVLDLLEQAATVVVVSAPAGSGKSIVARQWAERETRQHAVARVTSHLDDPVKLGEVLLDALEPLGRPPAETRARLTAAEPAFSATVLPALGRVAQTRDHPYLLVVDDVHLLQTEPAQRVLESVCEAVPDGSTVTLLTRGLAPAWLSRIRTTGRLLEISGQDLAFSGEETAALLEGLGLRLDAAVVRDVVEHTEGWPVGVYLTGLGLRHDERKGQPGTRLATGSDRAVSDYLRTQVIDALTEDQRHFLVRSSILEELDGSVCDAVLERTDSASVLADLHRRIQLIVEVDPGRPTYRAHHLLAEELAADLRTLEPHEIRGLHARAALWFDAHGDREAAIRHATASGDTDLAARMIWKHVPECVASGRLERLHAWLGALSDQQVSSDPWLTMAATWSSLQQGDADALRLWAARAERHAGPHWRDAASRDPYAATLAVAHALIGAKGIDDIRDLCSRAVRGLDPDDAFRAAALFNLGVVLTLQRDRDAGIPTLVEAQQLARALGVPIIEANALSWMGLLTLDSGDRQRGIRQISEAAEITNRHHLDRLATGALSTTAEALVLALAGDKATASTALATARRLTSLAGGISPWFAVTGRIIQARTAVLLGDGATARLLLAEARERLTPELAETAAVDGLASVEEALSRLSDHGGTAGVLTATEMRVLQFLPSYLTMQQIGEHLFVSQATVKTHVLSIYRKFGVSTRAEAVEHARALGLVESPIVD
jgi:LuxR family maltose regulon positive regulatory protein